MTTTYLPKHGHAARGKRSPTYKTWKSMLERCRNPNQMAYKNYGGRGISVCDDWFLFTNFLRDMGEKPKGLTLERTDNNGDYCPSNCRWASVERQANNKRNNRYITFNGETLSVTQWSRKLGLIHQTIFKRLKSGMTPEMALSARVLSARESSKIGLETRWGYETLKR